MTTETSSRRNCANERDVLATVLREQVSRQGALDIEALGSSMEPTVPGGSLLRIEPLQGAPARGELIAFVPERGALLCCHRVVAAKGERIVTQGDRHSAPDPSASSDRIIGVVRSFKLGGRNYVVGPHLPRPRPSLYRRQRQRVARALRRLRAA